MNNKNKYLIISLCLLNLSSCMMNDENYSNAYQPYSYNPTELYIPMDYSVTQYKYQEPQGEVSVPESYHVGQYQSPVSFKDRDRNWVTSQNAQGYTIELADDEKPAVVAKKLYNAPKNDRRAQIKYQRGGKSYYKGLYGTYNTPAEAQKALESLPDDVKKSAGVTSWGNVQGNLNE